MVLSNGRALEGFVQRTKGRGDGMGSYRCGTLTLGWLHRLVNSWHDFWPKLHKDPFHYSWVVFNSENAKNVKSGVFDWIQLNWIMQHGRGLCPCVICMPSSNCQETYRHFLSLGQMTYVQLLKFKVMPWLLNVKFHKLHCESVPCNI